VKVLLKRLDADLPAPSRAHPGDAGIDLFAAAPCRLRPGERTLVSTGVAVAIPHGFAGFVQPRSGLAIKRGVGVLNSPGLIDAGYRGEISVILINTDRSSDLVLSRGDKVAQLVIMPVPEVELCEVADLPHSERGTDGFGSTG